MSSSDPTYLVAFKEYTKSTATSADREAMEQEFYGESDRACVILQASWVELMVERAIRSMLRAEGASKIFDTNGPLGQFSDKILLGYGLEIFGTKTRHDLDLIRYLRNGFAHCQLPLRFSTPEVKAICNNLHLPDIEHNRATPLQLFDRAVDGGGAWHDKAHPRERYVICCYTIIAGLHLPPTRLPREAPELP